jgi:hypothetical protein
MRLLSLAAALFAAFTALAAPEATRIPLVMTTGQTVVHTAPTGLLTVTVVPRGSIVAHFDQYSGSVRLTAARLGVAKVLCEFVDNRIGEVLLVTVVSRSAQQRYERAAAALAGLEGIDGNSVLALPDRTAVVGTLYSMADFQRCLALERAGARGGDGVVCAARLSSAATALHPELGYLPRASLSVQERPATLSNTYTTGMEGESQWTALVRFGDVPVLRVGATDRNVLFGAATRFVARLNSIADRLRQDAAIGRAYPVTFTASSTGGFHQISAHWNFNQGSGGEMLLRVPAADLQEVSRESGVGGERLMQWWAALLQDSFRAYVLAERPLRTGGVSTPSPLAPLYNDALRLKGSQLAVDSSGASLSRAWFAQQFAAGRDPLTDLLIKVSPDFVQSTP